MSNPSIQEIFNDAYTGLKSQGFRQCLNEHGDCVYASLSGKRCAWGWADTTLTHLHTGSVGTLRSNKTGLAAIIDFSTLEFAKQLQDAHDWGNTPSKMEDNLNGLAKTHMLTIPSED